MVSVLSDLYDLTVLDADTGIGISLVFSILTVWFRTQR
jgi:hypothetical protein